MNRFSLLLFMLPMLASAVYAQPDAGESHMLMTDHEIREKVLLFAREKKLDSAALAKYDKIITFDREVYIGKIYNITFTDVRFTCPPDNSLNTVNKSRISQILYADGRRDVFIALEGRDVKQKDLVDTAKIIIKTPKDWMKVKITEDPGDIATLVEKGNLKAKYEADMGNMSNEELMQRASVILKKKAVVLKAHLVLIETKFFTNSYGDLPRVEVTARAFGYE
jgi:hypothetical protein